MLSVIVWAILILLVTFGVIAFVVKKKRKGKKVPENYYALFIIGAIYLPVGILMSVNGDDGLVNVFTIIGFVFLVTGLAHRDEWMKKGSVPVKRRVSSKGRKKKVSKKK